MSDTMELETLQSASAISAVTPPPAESPGNNEGASLLGKNRYTQEQLRKFALASAWTTIVFNIILGFSTFVYSLTNESDAGFAFGVDALLDVASLIVVIWRFNSPKDVGAEKREKTTCILIGILFIISSMIVVFKSVFDILMKNKPTRGLFLVIVASISTVVFLILAIFKCIVGRRLNSPALIADGFNSLLAVVMSVGILIASAVAEWEPTIWYIDSIVGLLVGLCVCVYGAKLINQTICATTAPAT